MDDRGFSSERIAALQAMYTPRQSHSTYAAMSPSEREFNDLVMNPLNWVTGAVGRRAVIGLSSKFAGPTRIAGIIKRPIHSTLAWKSQWNQPMGKILAKTLAGRKKWNQIALGYSLLHPLENLNYIRKKDWERLAVNTYLPIFGVPIYNHLLPVSGQPVVVQPSGPPRPIRNTPIKSPGRISSNRGLATFDTDLLGVSSGKTPGRRRQKSRSSSKPWVRTKGRKYCRRHRKYDFCHRKRYGNTR